MKYFIATYGCQANYADSERIARRLKNMGYTETNQIEKAKLVAINACSVRQSAMDKVYAKIKKIRDPGRRVKIILTGCILPADKKKLRNHVDEIWHPDEYFDPPVDGPIRSNPESAYVPIMTGCNNFCSYCAVPYTRGREKSRSAKEILKELKNLARKEYKEIWLLGQNVNSYAPNFAQLLKKINGLAGDFHIQFLTSHPKDMSDELIKTIAECEKVSKEIHLPLQSGDNATLNKMNRKYTIGHYKNLVKKIRKYIPEAKISTDIIVGFPGETKKQFENTAKAMEEIGFFKAYIACYSPRPGTAAAKLKDDIPRQEKKERRRILVEILEKQREKK